MLVLCTFFPFRLFNIYVLPFINLNIFWCMPFVYSFCLGSQSGHLLFQFYFHFCFLSLFTYMPLPTKQHTTSNLGQRKYLLVLYATEYCLVTTNPSLYANSRKSNLLYRSMVYASQQSNGTCMQILENVVSGTI